MMNEKTSIVKNGIIKDKKEKRRRSRPSKCWGDQMEEDTGMDLDTLIRIAVDRSEWRKQVNNIWAKSQH